MEEYGTKITEENKEILEKYLLSKKDYNKEIKIKVDKYVLNYPWYDNSYQFWGSSVDTSFSIISFEEFCKQENINMEKKSTDYCFILQDTDDYPEYARKYNYNLIGDCPKQYYWSTNEDNKHWSSSGRKPDRIIITWQEFKQLFIDKNMKTTQQEIDDLKAKLQELEDKVKNENKFKVGDNIIMIKDYTTLKVGEIYKIVKHQGGPYWVVSHSGDQSFLAPRNTDFRKATQAEVQEYLIAKCNKKYPKGTKFRTVVGSEIYISGGNAIDWKSERYPDAIGNEPGEGILYAEGKYAEIIKEEEIEISGYKANFNKANKTVSFGCKKDITKSDLEAILTVMKLNKKFKYNFSISEETFFQTNDTEFEHISKETIQKLIKALD